MAKEGFDETKILSGLEKIANKVVVPERIITTLKFIDVGLPEEHFQKAYELVDLGVQTDKVAIAVKVFEEGVL